MKKLISEDLLLNTKAAEILYHKYAAKLPIIDYNSCLSTKEIAKNKAYSNIGELYLPFFSYERKVKEASSDYEKFREICRIMPEFIENPLYIISHLALRRYFNCDLLLNEKNCDEIWKTAARALENGNITAKKLISEGNISLLCTNADPSDSLEYYTEIAEDKSFGTKVLPSFCPDKSIVINCEGICEYLKTLGDSNGVEIKDYASLKDAMTNALNRFHLLGCKIAKHTLNGDFTFAKPDEYHADLVLRKAIASNGKDVTPEEYTMFRDQMLYFFAEQYKKRGWVMQLHFSTFNTSISFMLDYFSTYNALPRTLFCSDLPYDIPLTKSYTPLPMQPILCHIKDSVDSTKERIKQRASYASLCKGFGIVNSPQSVISLPTHEYFKRILCDVIGNWVEGGLYPSDFEALSRLVCDIFYNNVKNFFEFDLK